MTNNLPPKQCITLMYFQNFLSAIQSNIFKLTRKICFFWLKFLSFPISNGKPWYAKLGFPSSKNMIKSTSIYN